jgi:hypothetical protein
MCELQYLDIGITCNHFEANLDKVGISGELIIDKPEAFFYITSCYREQQ